MHACPCGCGTAVTRTRYACITGWYRLPKPYRDAIWRGYKIGALSQQHQGAMVAARTWYERHPVGGRR